MWFIKKILKDMEMVEIGIVEVDMINLMFIN